MSEKRVLAGKPELRYVQLEADSSFIEQRHSSKSPSLALAPSTRLHMKCMMK